MVLLQDIVDLVGAAFREPEIGYKPRGNHGDEVGNDGDDDHLRFGRRPRIPFHLGSKEVRGGTLLGPLRRIPTR